MVSRVATLSLAFLLACVPVIDAMDRLPVPGGTDGFRKATNIPDSVPESMLLVEVARAWYGARDPIANPSPELRRLIEYIQTSPEPPAPGPPLPLPAGTWATMFMLRNPEALARAIIGNRSAMLMYHGLMGMDDETLRWMSGQRWLLRYILDDVAAPFSFAAPAIHVREGVVLVPGGPEARAAWESLVGESVAKPERFIRALLDKDRGRLAWLYSFLPELDPVRYRFAVGPGTTQIENLARMARSALPEWSVAERPFWRATFDFSMVLSLVDLKQGALRGSDEFWREVFRSDDLERFRQRRGEQLTSVTLLEILFEDPFNARDRWEIFSLGQRMAGVDVDDVEAGRALRAARRHPALAQLLDRIGVSDVRLRVGLHRASTRVGSTDELEAGGNLSMWQATLAVLERAALTGGLDGAEVASTLSELAELPLEDPLAELTTWLLDSMVPRLAARPGAPAGTESVLLETMSGALTPSGRSRPQPFDWEDLPYVVGAREATARRMRQVRSAQGPLTLDTASAAWQIAASGRGDVSAIVAALRDAPFPVAADQGGRLEEASQGRDVDALRREARRAAIAIVAALMPALAYAPHLAATDTPELGADIAFRHAFGTAEEAPTLRRVRAWQVAHGATPRGGGWRLQGSMLLLDVALSTWYLRHNGEPPNASPAFDEMDVAAFAQVPAFARAGGASRVQISEAAAAVEQGRQRARAAADLARLDDVLHSSGVDAWRRREILLSAGTVEQAAAALSYAEAWRLAGAPGLLSPRVALDACVCLGEAPHATSLMAGRRSAGVVGASAVDTQLRVATFLRARGLPDDLFGDVTAGVLTDIVEHTRALRPDDFRAIGTAAAAVSDTRLEEHLLALVADGTLGRPNQDDRREH